MKLHRSRPSSTATLKRAVNKIKAIPIKGQLSGSVKRTSNGHWRRVVDIASVATKRSHRTTDASRDDDDSVHLNPDYAKPGGVGLSCHCFEGNVHCGFNLDGLGTGRDDKEEERDEPSGKEINDQKDERCGIQSTLADTLDTAVFGTQQILSCGSRSVEEDREQEQDYDHIVGKTVTFDLPSLDSYYDDDQSTYYSYDSEDSEEYVPPVSIVPPLAIYVQDRESVEVGDPIVLDEIHNDIVKKNELNKCAEGREENDQDEDECEYEIALVIAAHIQDTCLETELLKDVRDQRLDIVYVEWIQQYDGEAKSASSS